MKRLFILIAVCMIGMVNALAGITVVPPQDQEHDFYELTFSGTVTSSDWNNLSDNVKNAKSLKIVTKDGYKLNSTDMAFLMGDNNQTSLFRDHLESLDMSDAELDSGNNDNPYSDLSLMTNATGDDATGLTHLKSFVFPKKIDKIPNTPKGMFEDNIMIEEVIMLERDDTNKSGFTTIPANTFKNASNLSNVRIPEGVTTIGPSAFGGDKKNENGGIVLTGPKMEAISFPNSLEYIEANAFANCPGLKSVTIPASVKEIKKYAFQNNISMEDVYVIGDDVKIGFSAFDNIMTYDGFRYNASSDGDSDNVTIWDWKKYSDVAQGNIRPLQLHFADNDTARQHYMNIALQLLNDDLLTDEILGYITENANSYYDANNPHYNDVKPVIDQLLNKYHLVLDQSFSIEYLKENSGWVLMDGHRYYTNPDGKFMGENTENDDINYGGWHNFMFAATDLENKTWPDNRMIDSRWYSAVFPFDMSYNQVMTAYGANTDVREFTYVNEHTVNGAKKRTVTFATIPAIPNNNKNEAGFVKKGMPYMIHPGVRSVPINVGEGEEQTTVYRTIAGVDVDAATAELENETKTVLRDLVDGDNNGTTIKPEAYTFKGTYKLANIPENTFYLGYDPDPDHYYPLAFYVTRKELVNKWNPFTSIVQHADESGNANSAKTMDLGFKDDGFEIMHGSSIATAIEAAPVVSNMNDGKVYNLSGQVVRENRSQSLAKGVYIIDGKKVVIR